MQNVEEGEGKRIRGGKKRKGGPNNDLEDIRHPDEKRELDFQGKKKENEDEQSEVGEGGIEGN